MKWFKKFFKKEEEYEVVQSSIPMSTIYRWYLYDTALAHPNKLAEKVGLTRVSDEGHAKEREDSLERLENIAPLFPYFDAISDMSAEVMLAIQSMEEQEPLTPEELASTTTVFKAIALSTLIGAASIGVYLGIMDADAIRSDVLEMDMTDEY